MPGSYRSDKPAGSAENPPGQSFRAVDQGERPTTESMRQLRRNATSAVTAVTFANNDGYHGVTVAAFCLVSLSPPRLLFCLGADSSALAAISLTGHVTVCVLSDRQEFIADQFAGRAPAVTRTFSGVKHQLSTLGDPILDDCMVWFSGLLDGSSPQGDHVVVFCDIQEAGFGNGQEPLLYFDGAYRSVRFDS